MSVILDEVRPGPQRETAAAPARADSATASPAGADVAAQLVERTGDLQRLSAEYANYRKRVERDRDLARTAGIGDALTALLPVLDDIDRARQHGELAGGFKHVADSLEAATARLGLESYGTAGETFDPLRHEALTATTSAEVSEPVVATVLQPGYSYAQKIIRPALVVVATPAESQPGQPAETEPAQ